MQSVAIENQIRFIQERVNLTERNFGDLCSAFAIYSRKIARVRDKGDDLVAVFNVLGQSDHVNQSTNHALLSFADTFAAVQDNSDAVVRRLECNVVQPLKQYQHHCKKMRETIKQVVAAEKKEKQQKVQLEKQQQKTPRVTSSLMKSATEFEQLKVAMSTATKSLETEMDQFEWRKLCDLKSIFLDFIYIQLNFHCKAVELYTAAFNQISRLEEAQDLENFRNTVKFPPMTTRLDTIVSLSNNLKRGSVFFKSDLQQSRSLPPSPHPERYFRLPPRRKSVIPVNSTEETTDSAVSVTSGYTTSPAEYVQIQTPRRSSLYSSH